MSNIVSGGGWNNEEIEIVEVEKTIRGCRYYIIWNVIYLLVALPITVFSIKEDPKFESPILVFIYFVFLFFECWLVLNIMRTWNAKTRKEIQQEERLKSTYDIKNLY